MPDANRGEIYCWVSIGRQKSFKANNYSSSCVIVQTVNVAHGETNSLTKMTLICFKLSSPWVSSILKLDGRTYFIGFLGIPACRNSVYHLTISTE